MMFTPFPSLYKTYETYKGSIPLTSTFNDDTQANLLKPNRLLLESLTKLPKLIQYSLNLSLLKSFFGIDSSFAAAHAVLVMSLDSVQQNYSNTIFPLLGDNENLRAALGLGVNNPNISSKILIEFMNPQPNDLIALLDSIYNTVRDVFDNYMETIKTTTKMKTDFFDSLATIISTLSQAQIDALNDLKDQSTLYGELRIADFQRYNESLYKALNDFKSEIIKNQRVFTLFWNGTLKLIGDKVHTIIDPLKEVPARDWVKATIPVALLYTADYMFMGARLTYGTLAVASPLLTAAIWYSPNLVWYGIRYSVEKTYTEVIGPAATNTVKAIGSILSFAGRMVGTVGSSTAKGVSGYVNTFTFWPYNPDERTYPKGNDMSFPKTFVNQFTNPKPSKK